MERCYDIDWSRVFYAFGRDDDRLSDDFGCGQKGVCWPESCLEFAAKEIQGYFSGVLYAITSNPAEHGRKRTWHARDIRTYTRAFRLDCTDDALTPNFCADGWIGSPVSGGYAKDRGCCTPTEGTCRLHDRSGRRQSWMGCHVERGRVGQVALGRSYRFGRGRFSYHDNYLNVARGEIFPGWNLVPLLNTTVSRPSTTLVHVLFDFWIAHLTVYTIIRSRSSALPPSPQPWLSCNPSFFSTVLVPFAIN